MILVIKNLVAYGFDSISLKLFHSYLSNENKELELVQESYKRVNRYFNRDFILAPLIFKIFY